MNKRLFAGIGFFLFFISFLHAQDTTVHSYHYSEKEPPPPPPDPPEVFIVAEQMPIFPGCKEEDFNNAAELQHCSNVRLMEFIQNYAAYPPTAYDKGLEGVVYLSFVVELDGRISTIQVLKGAGNGFDEAAVRVLELMNEKNIRWTPGLQNGQPVAFRHTIPIRFRLPKTAPFTDAVWSEACAQEADLETQRACTEALLAYYIKINTRLPQLKRKQAKQYPLPQSIEVRFMIDKSGTVIFLESDAAKENPYGDAAEQLIRQMNNYPVKWIPATRYGEKVNRTITTNVLFEKKNKK